MPYKPTTPSYQSQFPGTLGSIDHRLAHKEVVFWLRALNIGFFVFHTALVLFNMFGWIPRRTRRWNLALLLATACSWFLMGIWFGPGYCVCTDLHWRVRAALGYPNDSPTYIHLLVRSLTGADLPVPLVEKVTAAGFVLSLAASVIVNVRDFRRSKMQITSS